MFPRRNQPETAPRETASTAASHTGYMAKLRGGNIIDPTSENAEGNRLKVLR
jgi:hypothetical protein